MSMLKTVTVQLLQKIKKGVDPFGADIFQDDWVDVSGVLIGEPTTDDIITDMNLYGKHLAYTLAIPKGDDHKWTDTQVRFWGSVFKTYGAPTQGIDGNIPLKWNKKVKVEHYGQNEN